ncbi:MAG: ABC transporter permease [Ruminococcus sp.]|nr:ABC transporter permease [Ruminococcus sp.]
MKSIKRGERLTKFLIAVFLIGMCILVFKVVSEASFYMEHSGNVSLGCVYDRDGNVLYDPNATAETYGADYFVDVGNLIGDESGMMDNTLVSENMNLLENYDPIFGVMENGKSAVYTTLDHDANRTVYNAFGSYDGTAIAYNYETGEILVCVSKPNINILNYGDVESLPSGSMICKAFNPVTPGSTQKVSTLAAAIEQMGFDAVAEKRYSCAGVYYNNYGNQIDCHNLYGHGTQDIFTAFQNSCNPYFAQLVQEMKLDDLIETYKDMGYSVNGSKAPNLEVDDIKVFRGSAELEDVNEFDTQWGCMGQSRTEVSPCQLMMWQSAIANRSNSVTKPYLISYTHNMFGDERNHARTKYESAGFSADTAAYIREVMLANGKNRYNGVIGYPVGVKSGTAQVENGASEDSLLVGFVDDTAFPIAFCVVIEDNAAGAMSADSIVAIMLRAIQQ